MRRVLGVAVAALAIVAAVLGPVRGAWGADSSGARIASTDASGYPDVSVLVRADGAFAGRDLPPTAFSLRENGDARDVSVTRLADQDLQVVLALDTSGSMAGAPLAAAKQAALNFLTRMAPATVVGVVGFGSHPVVAAPLTTDRGVATRAVTALQAGGETSLYDAVAMALAQFPPTNGRRAVVVLSDGGDTVSTRTLDAVAAQVASAQARVDVVELVTSEANPAALQRLADAGGGVVVPADSPGALADAYAAVAASLVAEYRLSYQSKSHGDAAVHVTVTVDNQTAAADSTVHLPAATSPPAPPRSPSPSPSRAPVHTRQPFEITAADLVFVAGGWLVFAALLLVGLLVFMPTSKAAARLARSRTTTHRPSSVAEVVERATAAAEDVLTRQGWMAALNAQLELAGVALRPGEFLVFVACSMVAAAVMGLLLGGLLAGLLLAVVVAIGFRLGLSFKASGRQRRFHEQLPDTLQLLASSLRAGYGLLQAVDAVAREAESPTRDEFRRVVVEARLGRDLSGSLHAAAARVGGEDFEWVVLAIDVHREVGGDLAEVLDNVCHTIRERNQLRRQVRALTAEGRVSAYILVALPFCVAGLLSFVNPGYVSLLLHGFGVVLVGICVVLMVIGSLWLKKLCKLVF